MVVLQETDWEREAVKALDQCIMIVAMMPRCVLCMYISGSFPAGFTLQKFNNTGCFGCVGLYQQISSLLAGKDLCGQNVLHY